jgi:hypothetical protein
VAPGRGGIRYYIDGDTSGLQRALGEAESRMGRIGKAAGLAAGAAVAAGAVATGAFARLGLDEAIEQEKVAARTANVIKTTGGAANVTAAQVEKLAAAIQRQTGSADDAVQAGANLLLTFTKVRNEAGAGNDVFDQAVKRANDMSVALGTDLNGAALQVGKALNDPIRGVTALSRAGVSFTQQQRDQIRAMQESGNTLGAQKLILAELETQFGGAAAAEGESTEALQQLQRATEDAAEGMAEGLLPVIARFATFAREELIPRIAQVVAVFRRNWPQIRAVTAAAFEGAQEVIRGVMRWIEANVVPTIRSIVRNAQRFWATFGDEIRSTFALARNIIERSMRLIRTTIETVLALIRGDWSTAWRGLRGIVSQSFGLIYAFLKGVPVQMAKWGAQIGRSLADAIISGIGNIGSRIEDRLGIPGFLRGSGIDIGRRLIGRASGGFIPGTYSGRDDRIAAVASGEAILTPRQQAMVPGGRARLAAIFAMTGGRMGGDGFAAGGVVGGASRYVNPFPGGNWAGGPAAHRARALGNWQSDNAWDIMGASGAAVYAVLPGTIGRVSESDSRPGFAGQGVYLHTADGQWWYKHIRSAVRPGQRVEAGDIIGHLVSWTNGGPHLHLATPSGDPARARSGATPGSSRATEGASDGDGSSERHAGPTMAQRIGRLIGGSAAKALGRGALDLSDGSAPSFTASQDRSVSAAGRAARTQARAAGMSPDEVARAGDEAERAAEVRVLNKQLALAREDLSILGARKAKLLAEFRKLGRRRVGPGDRPAKKKAMAQMRKDLDAYTEEMSEVREEIAEISERLREIGEQVEAERYQDQYDQAAADAAARQERESSAGSSVSSGPSPDQQAQLDQATTRAETAAAESRAFGAFVAALKGSGDIDPRAGTVIVNVAGSLVQESQVASWIFGNAERNAGRRVSVMQSPA